MLRIFGYGGFAAFFQPIKNALRWQLLGAHRPWQPPCGAGPVFIKETFGPFQSAEVSFDPLAELICAGVPPARIRLVILLRDPGLVWASWQSLWPKTAKLSRLAQSYAACERVMADARRIGVAMNVLEFAECVAAPLATMAPIFAASGQKMPPDVFRDWHLRPAYGAPGSGVHLPVEPDLYITPGAHDRVSGSTGFEPVRPRAWPSKADLAQIESCGLDRLYRQMIKRNKKVSP